MAAATAPTIYTADERGAYALSGVFKTLAGLVAAIAVLAGLGLAVTNTGIDLVQRTLVFLSVAGSGLVLAAFLLFFGYVLALLVSIQRACGTERAVEAARRQSG